MEKYGSNHIKGTFPYHTIYYNNNINYNIIIYNIYTEPATFSTVTNTT